MTVEGRLLVDLGALHLDLPIDVAAGSVMAILGPNGAGKTTAIRALAGLQPLTDGHLRLGGVTVDEPASATFVPPAARQVGFVPQHHSLFPHLSVLDNVAFGPRSTGADRRAARAMARPWIERVGLDDCIDRRPTSLSGGQAQRVALARALATEPAVLLLDEPLSALDVTTRVEVRRELRTHLEDFAGSTVIVSHDPLDALTLADQVLVLEAGAVSQSGPLSEVAARPRTRYVADLVGANLLTGLVRSDDPTSVDVGTATVHLAEPVGAGGDQVLVRIAPTAVTLHLGQPEGSARNAWPVRIEEVDGLGGRVRVRLSGSIALVAEVTTASAAALRLRPGLDVWASVKATEVDGYAG